MPGRPPRAAVQFRKPAALIKRLWKAGSVLSALVSGQERSEERVVGANVSGTRQSLLWGSYVRSQAAHTQIGEAFPGLRIGRA